MRHSFIGVHLLPERRISPRAIFHRRGSLFVSDNKQTPIRTVDISSHGLQFICPHPLPYRQNCSLNIGLLNQGVPDVLELQGIVSHCILSGELGFKIGLQYSGLPHKSKTLISQIVQSALSEAA